MNNQLFKLVCLGSFLTSFAYGVMLTLPLFLSDTLKLSLVVSSEIISMGIIGVVASILSIPYVLKSVSTNVVAAMGALIYAFAIALILYMGGVFLYIAGLLLGAGWGIIYTLGPIMVSSTSDTAELSRHFMFISAFNMLGAGLSPVIVKTLLDYNIAIEYMFMFAVLLSLLAGGIFFNVTLSNKQNSSKLSILPVMKTIVTSNAVIPLIMVFLGACIYISMMNFQFVFAKEKNLNFSIFYISYTFSLLFARFFLAKFILKLSQQLAMIGLLFIMLIALCLFLVTTNNIFYIVPSSLLGISYGLVYPLIQTQMVKDIDAEKRSIYLTIFSLSYFIGVFGYPYLFSLGLDSGGVLGSFLVLISLCLLDIVFACLLFKKFTK